MFLITSRVIWSKSTTALVVISPTSTTSPVLQSVSAPTREYLSCASSASSTASEIWSETLSGWPSETDSEVKRKLLVLIGVSSLVLANCQEWIRGVRDQLAARSGSPNAARYWSANSALVNEWFWVPRTAILIAPRRDAMRPVVSQ